MSLHRFLAVAICVLAMMHFREVRSRWVGLVWWRQASAIRYGLALANQIGLHGRTKPNETERPVFKKRQRNSQKEASARSETSRRTGGNEPAHERKRASATAKQSRQKASI